MYCTFVHVVSVQILTPILRQKRLLKLSTRVDFSLKQLNNLTLKLSLRTKVHSCNNRLLSLTEKQ